MLENLSFETNNFIWEVKMNRPEILSAGFTSTDGANPSERFRRKPALRARNPIRFLAVGRQAGRWTGLTGEARLFRLMSASRSRHADGFHLGVKLWMTR